MSSHLSRTTRLHPSLGFYPAEILQSCICRCLQASQRETPKMLDSPVYPNSMSLRSSSRYRIDRNR
jgi:hypothetical protein